MAKRFRLRISKIIPSFRPCRSKDPSSPLPSFFRLSPVNPKHRFPAATTSPPPPSSKSQRSSLKQHVSSALMSVGCGTRSRSSATLSDEDETFQWEKEDKWHVVAKVYEYDVGVETPRRKIYTSSVSGRSDYEDDDLLPPPPPPPSSAEKKKKRRMRRKKKKKTTRSARVLLRLSTSSAESGLFSSESFEEEETETLVSSSRSFSTDSSSEYNPRRHLETIREVVAAADMDGNNNYVVPRRKKIRSNMNKTPKRCVSNCTDKGRKSVTWQSEEDEEESESSSTPARLSVFQRMISCPVDGKVRESFAVVKKSADPYEDFKRSMMEMILEKQMFDHKDLEQLLHCFLSLNSRSHHGIIVQAFTEIWEALFCSTTPTTSKRVSTNDSLINQKID